MRNNKINCQLKREILNRVGDKWSILVIMILSEGKLRFNQLKDQIPDISQRMLTLTLRNLERDGLVIRTYHTTMPPKVEYELSALGESLLDPVFVLFNWAFDNQEQIQNARISYDKINNKI